jgi:hypothetical protein
VPRQAYFLAIEVGLYLAQDGVVDVVIVAESDHGGAFAGEEGQAQGGVVLGMPQHGVVVGAAATCAQDLEVRLVLVADPVDDLRGVSESAARSGSAFSASSVARVSARKRSSSTEVSRGSLAYIGNRWRGRSVECG